MKPNGTAPDFVQRHPALKGIDLSQAGRPEHSPILLTKTLLFTADGGGMYAVPPGAGGPMFRALDKRTGKLLHEMKLPANVTGIPMTYMLDGVQYLVMAIGAPGVPGRTDRPDGAVRPGWWLCFRFPVFRRELPRTVRAVLQMFFGPRCCAKHRSASRDRGRKRHGRCFQVYRRR